jgi:hypothetical protein
MENDDATSSVAALLARLDLATEVLEGLDELGVENRVELESLMERLERKIADESWDPAQQQVGRGSL